MATNVVLSLRMAAAAGLAAVGSITPFLLVYQLGSGLLQQVVAEASLLAPSGTDRRLDVRACRRGVAVAMAAGLLGVVLASLSASIVPGGDRMLGLVFALGIPAGHGLDIGSAAGVAWRQPRQAALEGGAWGLTQAGVIMVAGGLGSPVWICAAWTVTNWIFFIGSTASAARPRCLPDCSAG